MIQNKVVGGFNTAKVFYAREPISNRKSPLLIVLSGAPYYIYSCCLAFLQVKADLKSFISRN